jgi:O-glycosyl hydrolase
MQMRVRRFISVFQSDGIETVAFENPDGSIVTVVANTDWNDPKDFQILIDDYYYVSSLPARSVATIVKRP